MLEGFGYSNLLEVVLLELLDFVEDKLLERAWLE